MKIDPRFLAENRQEIFNGNELLLKGALEVEGGVHLLGGYPGSPISAFFDSIALVKDLLNEKGIRAVINNNEALAAAMLNGSQVVGCRTLICMKSVGVHVAADALALGSLAGAPPDGGAVVCYGEDPWADSTQVPSDSRFISKHLFIPVIEPADPQEVKDFVDLAFKLSRLAGLYAGYILPTNLADGGGSVMCRANQYPNISTKQKIALDTASIDLDRFVLLPPRTWWQEEKYAARFARAVEVARELGLNRLVSASGGRKPVGFATSGLAHGYLVQALWEMGLLGEFPILKLGMSYPVDAQCVRQLAEACERIVVVEERRGFLEEQISEVVLQDRQADRGCGAVEVWGKTFPDDLKGFPTTRGLHPSIIIRRLAPLLKRINGSASQMTVPPGYENLDRELETIDSASQSEVASLPVRLATFCPGCPHRDSASLCLEIKKRFMDADYMRRVHGCEPVDLVFHGDTGCYTMLTYPPNTPLMHDYSGMGLGGGTGSGMDPFVTNKQVVFMGDSTFFHSGQIAIGQAVKLGQDITFIILDNSTTAMTGHQPTPGVDYDVMGNPTPAQDIEAVVTGITAAAGVPIYRVDPEKREEYAQLLEKTFLADGVKVIIADKECAITRLRRQRREERAIVRRKGFLPRWEHMNINSEICTFCLACAEMTGCPGLKHVQTDYGRRMDTDLTWCVNDGACERLGACSSFEHVTIKRKRPPRQRAPELALEKLSEPPKRPAGDVWRACLVGRGGQGVGLATSILVRAGHKEGYPVIFLDKKGLAIRNGGVVSQVVYNISSQPITPVIPYGKADLLIGIDILEAARALDPAGRMRFASPEKTAAVINTDKLATIVGLMGNEDFDPHTLEATIRRHTRGDDYLARNISRICEKYLGSKIYANVMMLGFAFQKGLIPVSMHSMAWAIKDAIRADFRKNLYAFNMGRKLVEDVDLFAGPPQRTGWAETLEDKCRWTIRRYARGERLAEQFRELAAELIGSLEALEEADKRALVVRLYDCMRWGGIDYARRYARGVEGIYRKDRREFGLVATRAVLDNLARAMLIKDGVFIAELATSPEKFARDREKYNVNPANGDRIVYRHLLHPKLSVGRREVTPRVAARTWMLKLFKRARFLRALAPRWHRLEKQFLRQYEQRVAAFDYSSADEYRGQLAGLGSPQCMTCLNPRCQEAGCPLESPIPEWVTLSLRGDYQAAAELLHGANNFPEFTGLICPAPCEAACKQGLNGYPVRIQEIEREIIERAFAEGWVSPRPAAETTHRRVAVIGSGPAGLAAAQQLARRGHEVTVFEKEARPGGLLRYGIPDHRLEKWVIDRRLEQLVAEGVAFRTETQVGRDISAAELRRDYDAICLATGASAPKDLDVPGRRQQDVHFALDFLRQANASSAGTYVSEGDPISASNKVVAVIGGGLTGEDCVEIALKQGAKRVHQLEILSQQAINGRPDLETSSIQRQWCVATKQFDGAEGKLQELRAVKVRWLQTESGPLMEEKPGSEFRVKADMALLAMGYEPIVEPALAEQLSLARDPQGRIVLEDNATGAAGVFAAGDLVTGASYVATAIDSGRKAAERIDEYLAGLATKSDQAVKAVSPSSLGAR